MDVGGKSNRDVKIDTTAEKRSISRVILIAVTTAFPLDAA